MTEYKYSRSKNSLDASKFSNNFAIRWPSYFSIRCIRPGFSMVRVSLYSLSLNLVCSSGRYKCGPNSCANVSASIMPRRASVWPNSRMPTKTTRFVRGKSSIRLIRFVKLSESRAENEDFLFYMLSKLDCVCTQNAGKLTGTYNEFSGCCW